MPMKCGTFLQLREFFFSITVIKFFSNRILGDSEFHLQLAGGMDSGLHIYILHELLTYLRVKKER